MHTHTNTQKERSLNALYEVAVAVSVPGWEHAKFDLCTTSEDILGHTRRGDAPTLRARKGHEKSLLFVWFSASKV